MAGEQQGFERSFDVGTEQIQIDASIEVDSTVDDPIELADEFEQHMTDALVDFVISQEME